MIFLNRFTSSSAGQEIAAHAFAAAVGAKQTRAEVTARAGGAVCARRVGTAEALRALTQLIARLGVFVIGGVKRAGSIKGLLGIEGPAAAQLHTALQKMPFGRAVGHGNALQNACRLKDIALVDQHTHP